MIVALMEERGDALGYLRPHFLGALQFFRIRRGTFSPDCRSASRAGSAVRSPTKRIPRS